MILSIIGVVAALLAAIVGVIGSFRSTPLLSKSNSDNAAMLNALVLYFERQEMLYKNLCENKLSDPSSISKLEDMVEKCDTVRNTLIMRFGSVFEYSQNVANSRIWQLTSFFLVIISIACQVAALLS